MSELPSHLDPSFADAVSIIAAAPELRGQTRTHWLTSLRRVAKALDKPLASIPASYRAVRSDLAQLHPVPAGLTAKTLQNHKSNVKSALLWLAREKGSGEHGAPLTPAWEQLRAGISPGVYRSIFSSLMRYCSANNIAPVEVDDAVIDRFMAYRSRIGKSSDNAFRRRLSRAWNSNVEEMQGWRARRLLEPPVKRAAKPAWDEFPEGLRRDVEGYLDTLTRVRRTATGRRARPQKPSSIRQRRAELQAAARMAVRSGVPIETLNSLSGLLSPDVVERILDGYWRGNGDTPKVYTISLASKFLGIARETKCLDEAACERLDEMRHSLEDHRSGGLTDKNSALIRKVLSPGVWNRVVKLPPEMMASAHSHQLHAPTKAAVTAQLAVAIGILTVAPVRLANLGTIKLGTNLIKPDGPDSNYWLVFPDHDVKNRVKLEFPLEQYLTQLIDEYVYEFRPTLLRGSNGDALFPGQCSGAKQKAKLSTQITARIFKATGLRMTVHQFRHAAGALILQARPGEYELVRRLLGHRDIKTTIDSYVGLENVQASEIFSKIVMEHMEDKLEAAE
jgi:hypothetical protein